MNGSGDKKLFWACFIALIATAFGFIVRAENMDTWAAQFGFDETRKGQLFGVGLWPFAISIVLFSLIIDKIGYGKAMIFAFICHASSIAITVCAPMFLAKEGSSPAEVAAGQETGYWMLYLGNFIVALGNGTVEAVINPVVATVFAREKTKWLNMLHAGWPGGLVLGGILALAMGENTDWRLKVGLLALPVVIYGLMMMTCTFPVNERVTAGVSYWTMLREVGMLGALVVSGLIVWEVTNVMQNLGMIFQGPKWDEVAYPLSIPGFGDGISEKNMVRWYIIGGISLAFGLLTLSLGRFIFFCLLVIMIPLATTELGTDSWIGDLMKPEMKAFGLPGGVVLIYTSFIMMVLRFFAGPIVHALSPLGLLMLSAAIAAGGLLFLSQASGVMILVAATLYGFGKTFFWPTMLGVTAERFPKGGALTLNITGGVGMLGVGVLGSIFLGNIQDKEIDKTIKNDNPGLHSKVIGSEKVSVFGNYNSIDSVKVNVLSEAEQTEVTNAKNAAKKTALKTVAIFPVGMFVAYLLLFLFFKVVYGGYRPEDIEGDSPRH
jgi:MFS family permease